MSKLNVSRREFLRLSSMLGSASALGVATPFALNLATMGSAAAQGNVSDYKAIVCLFMYGANDHANTVLATDTTSWTQYTTVRTTAEAGSIALPAVGTNGGVLPITPSTPQVGRSFGLHPSLTDLKTLFDNKRAAIIANVGPLIVPTTLTQYQKATVPLPPKLFSHNDQQSLWQAYAPEGASYGWGGRMGDLLAANNSNPIFTAISTSGNAVFLSGRNIIQYQVSASGATPITGLSGTLYGSSTAGSTLRSVITGDTANYFQKEHAAVTNRAINAQALLGPSMAVAGPNGVPNPGQYTNPNTGALANNALATQLQTVARIIAGRNALGAKRQVFFVSMGGFDTHDFQKTAQADLLARLSHAINYFDGVMGNLMGTDLRNQVTLFTASDFGRTFTSNGDGTDHGWGSHHFIVGGAVKGGNIYGTFPVTGLKHAEDVGSGSLLPQFSVDQYGATLATWFGLTPTQISDVFPNIGNFATRNLGFI
ncbi:DUF1501 domain-containing protein [Undibacterium cyanobacteriorum]|uniref:DUF1501 domain-containing protein n=1 Tax=Undibacterium cyanobacteriorum TaxID=3073561 RepID=A0ABY9RCU2_9BURK|nr:DUF1501 domain-containing protein [Undibacterium sp. 20NA77.5]WMW79071.1 DUF1501 domain-containing protein [Undibacterium sp. 20NA77.5]